MNLIRHRGNYNSKRYRKVKKIICRMSTIAILKVKEIGRDGRTWWIARLKMVIKPEKKTNKEEN